MLECPICGTKNSKDVTKCSLCSASLNRSDTPSHKVLEDSDISSETISLKKTSTVLSIVFLVFIPLYLISGLFSTTEDAKKAKHNFDLLVKSYKKKPSYWNKQKEQITTLMQEHQYENDLDKVSLFFKNQPLEILIAYLVDSLHFTNNDLKQIALYPKEGSSDTFIFYKKNKGLWPLRIPYSLDVQISDQVTFKNLFRGNSEVPSRSASYYFSKEFDKLAPLTSLYGGIKNYKIEQTESSESSSLFSLSFEYHQRSVTESSF